VNIILYNLFIKLYVLGIGIASIWNDKAKQWIHGRKIFPVINNTSIKKPTIWMHCASLGEFEQGRPVIEKIRAQYPHCKIVLTFFSSSGFEIQKKFTGADFIFYLPTDSALHAKKFINLINPTLVLWIKYEFWYYYLEELRNRNIPVLLISASFRKDQTFFKWYGAFWKNMLHCFTFYFVQNENSKNLLNTLGFKNAIVSGDTRFDRVITIAENLEDIALLKEFCNNSKVIVAGSTWEDDEAELVHYVKTNPWLKFIIAPHEVDKENLEDVKKVFTGSIFYSELNENNTQNHNVVIIDNIGMLSRLYSYADVTYVGGGFGDDGLHNILEAAVYGKPVIFGPELQKNFEAAELIECGGGISIENALELEDAFNNLLNNEPELKRRSEAAKKYVYSNAGATEKVIQFIQENRLLTS